MRIHYIIFHPENQRQIQNVSAISLVSNTINHNWQGNIYVDKIRFENEDPYVFNDPWIYSYCHASQLRQSPNHHLGNIQGGSWLIFVSGQYADNGILIIDTCYLVDNIHPWIHNPLTLPVQFQYLHNDLHNDLWTRHFKFPFLGQHTGVKNTFTAKLWDNISEDYSFLPYNSCGDRISFPISRLTIDLANKIKGKIWGKYPVDLLDNEISEILEIIDELTQTKVLKNIHEI